MESVGKHLNQLAEVYAFIGNVVEDCFVAVSLIFHIPDFHIEVEVKSDLAGTYHRAVFTRFRLVILVHIHRFGFAVDALDIRFRLDICLTHL